MAASELYDPRLDIVVHDKQGRAVATATAWSAGTGKCGLLEPVGTHRDHRRQDWGKAVVEAAAFALQSIGASSVAVITPQANLAAVDLYRSAGFRVLVPISAIASAAV